MKKIKVLIEFKDIHSKELYEVDSVLEVSEERLEEMKKNLSKYKSEFFKEVKQRKRKQKKEEVDSTEEEGA